MNEQITSAAELDALTDLVVRLNRANKGLLSQSRTNITSERTRLEGKAEGVRLALSYVEEAIRARPDQPQRVQPSREDVARRILDKTVGVVDCELHERLMTPMWDRAMSAADAMLALFAQQPTVAEVKAEALPVVDTKVLDGLRAAEARLRFIQHHWPADTCAEVLVMLERLNADRLEAEALSDADRIEREARS